MFITLDFYIIYTFLELKEGKCQNGKMAKKKAVNLINFSSKNQFLVIIISSIISVWGREVGSFSSSIFYFTTTFQPATFDLLNIFNNILKINLL